MIPIHCYTNIDYDSTKSVRMILTKFDVCARMLSQNNAVNVLVLTRKYFVINAARYIFYMF